MKVSSIDRCCKKNCKTDVIESIAYQEAALAHILNAEGEKLQKVLAKDDVTVEEILKINKSINCTISEVTNLEVILINKLKAICDCDCSCHIEPCKKVCIPREIKVIMLEISGYVVDCNNNPCGLSTVVINDCKGIKTDCCGYFYVKIPMCNQFCAQVFCQKKCSTKYIFDSNDEYFCNIKLVI